MKQSKKATHVDALIAQRLKRIREESGIAMRRVADYIGISYQYYQRMESGSVAFRASTVFQLCQFFDVDHTAFYGSTFEVDPDRVELLAAFLKVPPDRRGEAVESLYKIAAREQ